MPLYISRIRIKNFRNFKDLDLRLNASTVVLGENKAGKSNLLHALRLILDPSLSESSRTLKIEDFWDGLKNPFSGKRVKIVVELTGFEDDKAAQAVLTDCIVSKQPYVARLTYIFRPREKLEREPLSEGDYEYVIFGGIDEKHRVGSNVRRWISVFLLPALRDAESELESWRRSPLRPLLEKLNIDSKELKALMSALNAINNKLVGQKSIADLADNITSRIDSMVGSAYGLETRLGLTPTESDQLIRSIKIFVDGDKSRTISQASLGSANVLLLALLLQNFEANRSTKSLVSTILAIEEPEAHLHPQVQRLLLRYFLAQKHPIIVTTHSPNIASVAPIDSLVLLRRTVKTGSVGYSTSGLKLSDDERDDLQRYLDVTRAEILFAKGVILVEGPAEQFLLPAFAKSLKDSHGEPLDLDRLGISICSVYGTEFRPYRRLLGSRGISLPHVIITDRDPTTRNQAVVQLGLLRGIKLVEDDEIRKQVTQDYAKKRWASACRKLAEDNIFVNNNTLEIDLVDDFADELGESYHELVGSKTKADHFSELLQNPAANRDGILSRIERIGKGRFAQRLAAKLIGSRPPSYLKDALQRIVDLVAS